MKDKKLRDHLSFKEFIKTVHVTITDYLLLFKEWITDYGKVILPMILLIFVSATVMISLNARDRVEIAAEEALVALEETKAEVNEVRETAFEVDVNADINYLMLTYYEALEMGDVDALIDIQSAVTNTEVLRLEKMSAYIDRYENIHVYTKPGPYLDTYIAYVYSDIFLKDREESTPGLQAFYVCMDDFGNYFINNSELSDEEATYIRNISEQSDVVDLKNTVNVNYKIVMEDNEELSQYWADISVEIDLAVGEQLALDAKLQAQLEEEPEEEEIVEEVVPEEPVAPTVTKVKTTSSVNVRKSASATADRLGSAAAGDTFVMIEQMANGWTKLEYEGKEGFIKSEFLTVLEDISIYNTVGTVKSTTTLNVRAEANQTASKIGVLSIGETADLIEVLDEWCKIKFNGQIGYVKKEYVEY